MEKHNRPSKRSTQLWLIDYDLKNEPCRRQFYRKVARVMGEKGLTNSSSSLSVVATKDEKTARTVYDLASKCGTANLYKVTKADPQTNRSTHV